MTQVASVPPDFKKILMVGLGDDIPAWFRHAIVGRKLPWRVRTVEPLRIGAPETQILNYDTTILLWEPFRANSLEDVLGRRGPKCRSPEGVLRNIEQIGQERLLQRCVILGQGFKREDTVLLAEHGVKLVITLPEQRSKWDDESDEVFEKIKKNISENLILRTISSEKQVDRFTAMLGVWSRLSDETRMKATEDLLRELGDSARYAEFMARKALAEADTKAAERWILKAIDRNPNYLKAYSLLAEVYMHSGQHQAALGVLDKLHLNSPNNTGHMTKKGQCLTAVGEYQKAEKVLTDAVCIDEFDNKIRENLGKVKCVLGEHDIARSLLSSAQNTRELAVFMNTLGVKFVEKGEFQTAIDHYKTAQYVIPGNQEGHMLFFNIALAYLKWNKPKDALRYARLALIRDPSYEKASKLISLIQERLKELAI